MSLAVTVQADPPAEVAADLLAVGAYAANDEPDAIPFVLSDAARSVEVALGIDLAAELTALGFRGKPGSTARIPTRGAIPARTVLVVGLGSD